MQELLKEAISVNGELGQKSILLYVQSKLFTLEGEWQWEMFADMIFCTDVMLHLPTDFIGTKGIIHPDDIADIHKNIYFSEAIGEEETFDLSFRIITSYGEVRSLTGKKIKFLKKEPQKPDEDPVALLIQKKAEDVAQAYKDRELLRFGQNMAEFTEKLNHIGTWYFNLSTRDTFYSEIITAFLVCLRKHSILNCIHLPLFYTLKTKMQL